MNYIERALNELYVVAEEPEDRQEHLENAIELLEDGLAVMKPGMACDEIADVVQNLASGSEIDNLIYELEVINNEM